MFKSFSASTVLLFLTLILGSVSEQKNLIPAYLITAAGDTVTGLLKQQRTAEIFRTISFKPTGSDTFRSYGTENLRGFVIADSILFVIADSILMETVQVKVAEQE